MRVPVFYGVLVGLVFTLVLSVSSMSWLIIGIDSADNQGVFDPYLFAYCADQEISIRSHLPTLQPKIAPFVYGHNWVVSRDIKIEGMPFGPDDWQIKPIIPKPDVGDLLSDLFLTDPLRGPEKQYKISDCAVFPPYQVFLLESGLIEKS